MSPSESLLTVGAKVSNDVEDGRRDGHVSMRVFLVDELNKPVRERRAGQTCIIQARMGRVRC